MNDTKSPLSIKVFYWLSTISFYLLIVVFAAAIVFNVLLYTNFFGNDLQLHVHFPAKIDLLEIGTYNYNGENVKIEFVEAQSRIHFFNTPTSLARKFALSMLIIFSLSIFINHQFRGFIKNVKNGMVFHIKNIKLLKNIAYAIAGIWAITVTYLWITYFSFADKINIENVKITDDVPNYTVLLLLALFLWIIAHVFEVGLKLQKEQDLTI